MADMNRREEKQTEVPGTENVETPNLRDLAGYSSGFFGVFDGHGGQQCSSFVAKRLTEDLAVGSGLIDCHRYP